MLFQQGWMHHNCQIVNLGVLLAKKVDRARPFGMRVTRNRSMSPAKTRVPTETKWKAAGLEMSL